MIILLAPNFVLKTGQKYKLLQNNVLFFCQRAKKTSLSFLSHIENDMLIIVQYSHNFAPQEMNLIYMLSKIYNITTLLFMCLAYQGYSQSDVSSVNINNLDSSFYNKTLNEVVVTGNYKPTGIDKSVVPTRIISLSKLSPLAAQNVADVLKYQANLRIQQDNILGTGMTMQGISGENIKILINGVPVNGRQNGNIDLGQLNINNVERIEIVEGPLSVQYGTNALAGTINIITKKKPAKDVDFNANTYYESVGHYNVNTSFGWQINRQSFLLSGGRNFFQGWSEGDTSRFQTWKPKIQYFGDVNYNIDLGKTKIGFMGNYFNEFILNRGRPLLPYFEKAFDDHYTTTRYSSSLNLTHQFDNQLRTNILISYSDYTRTKNTYYRDLVNLSEIMTNNSSDQDTTRFNMLSSRGTVTKTTDEKLNFEAGYDINVETGSGLRLKGKNHSIGDYAAFASAEWHITEGVTFRPGLRASFNTSYQAPLIPSAHILWKITDQFTLRASYGRGFRSPSLKELYFYFVDINHNIRGNENLEAEKSHNLNTFLTYKKVKAKNVYKAEASLFYNKINNLITLAILRGEQNEYGYINVGQYNTSGGQLFGEIVLNNFSVGSGASLTRSMNVFNNERYPADTWETRSNLTYTFPKAKMNFNFWFKHVSKQPGYVLGEDGKIQPIFVGTYNLVDFGTSKKFMKDKMMLSFGIKNIFNVKNIDSQLVGGAHSSSNGSSSLATGRNLFVKCEISL